MAEKDDNIQNVFTGRDSETKGDPDLIAAKQWGDFLERHQAQENFTPDTSGFMQKVKQKGLLDKGNNVTTLQTHKRFKQQTVFALAASLFIAVLAPLIYINQTPTFPEYGEIRAKNLGEASHTITAKDSVATALALKEKLKQHNIDAALYRYNGSMLLEAFIDEGQLTPSLLDVLKEKNITKSTEGRFTLIIQQQ